MLKELKLQEEYIKLDNLLKFLDIADSGGHAKIMILNGDVKVNNEIVTQRGKKIRVGDIVEVGNTKLRYFQINYKNQ